MQARHHKILRYSAITLVSLIVLFAIIIALLPGITRLVIQSSLEDYQLEATIENIDINLFDGHVLIEDLKIMDEQGVEQAHLGKLDVSIEIWELLDDQLIIKDLLVDDVYINIQSDNPQHLTVAGLYAKDDEEDESEDDDSEDKDEKFVISLGNVSLKQLKFCYQFHEQASPALHNGCTELASITNTGAIKLLFDSLPGVSLTTHTHIELAGIGIHDRNTELDILLIESIVLSELNISDLNYIVLNGIKVSGIKAFQAAASDNNYIATLDKLNITAFILAKLEEKRVGVVTLSGLKLDLSLTADKTFNLTEAINQYVPVAEETQKEVATALPVFIIERITIADNSGLKFRDESINPVFETEISALMIDVSNIDTTTPETTIKHLISFVVGKHGEINFEGESSQPGIELKLTTAGSIKALDLVQVNPYIQNTIGYNVSSGSIDSKVEFKIEKNRFDALFDNKLHHFYLADLTEEQQKEIKNDSSMPLPTALSLLRQKDGSIELELPITGDVNNPDFSVSDAINQVLGKAIRSAILYYYNPYGLLTFIVSSGIDEVSSLEFAPVLFAPDSSELDGEAQAQLEKIVTMLDERPEVRMVICGQASHDDYWAMYPEVKRPKPVHISDEEEPELPPLPALTEKDKTRLDALSAERTKVVRDYIIGAAGNDIASRLLECQVLFDATNTEPPRTELRL